MNNGILNQSLQALKWVRVRCCAIIFYEIMTMWLKKGIYLRIKLYVLQIIVKSIEQYLKKFQDCHVWLFKWKMMSKNVLLVLYNFCPSYNFCLGLNNEQIKVYNH